MKATPAVPQCNVQHCAGCRVLMGHRKRKQIHLILPTDQLPTPAQGAGLSPMAAMNPDEVPPKENK